MGFILLHRDVYVDAFSLCTVMPLKSFIVIHHTPDLEPKCGWLFEINTQLIHNLFGIPKGGLTFQPSEFNFEETT